MGSNSSASRLKRSRDVTNALGLQNIVLPSGTAKMGANEYPIILNSSPAALEDGFHVSQRFYRDPKDSVNNRKVVTGVGEPDFLAGAPEHQGHAHLDRGEQEREQPSGEPGPLQHRQHDLREPPLDPGQSAFYAVKGPENPGLADADGGQ